LPARRGLVAGGPRPPQRNLHEPEPGAAADRDRPGRRGQAGQGHTGAAPLMRLVFAAATDVGRMRKNKEDSYLSSKPVAAVADGMGGHSAGEVASAIAIEELAALGN